MNESKLKHYFIYYFPQFDNTSMIFVFGTYTFALWGLGRDNYTLGTVYFFQMEIYGVRQPLLMGSGKPL